MSMKKLIETIAIELVDYPDEVNVKEVSDETSVTYTLFVHPDDVGKVIGKQGRVAKAIRSVVYAAGSQVNKKINVEING